MDKITTRMQSHVTGALADHRPWLNYIIKCDDVPAGEIAIFTEMLFFNYQTNPGILAEVIWEELKKRGKRYFLTTCYSSFLGHDMRYFIETGLAAPRTHALIEEKYDWMDKTKPVGMAVVFELR